MKRYYLVKVRFDDKRFPFTNVVYEADSPEQAIEKYWAGWGDLEKDKNLKSIEAEYLGVTENIGRWISTAIGFCHYYSYIPVFLLVFVFDIIMNYDPQMFKSRERAKDPYRRWVYWVSYLGRPLYWGRCLLGKRDKMWTDMEKESEV